MTDRLPTTPSRRQLAMEECRNRYGHRNVTITDDPSAAGHYYAGPEETFWVVEPEDLDPGVLYPIAGAHCLCCAQKNME